MAEPEQIPPPPPTIPASPLARDIEAAVERVFSRVIERVDASYARLEGTLKHLFDEFLKMKREIEHIKVRMTAHDIQIAELSAVVLRTKTKRKRRAARKG